ncbi:MAG: O-antigen ligase family protein [Desulfuromonadaceae bacterium]|nr:O-antigen ligase family protein [Desulfuromonadaceae bacterium]
MQESAIVAKGFPVTDVQTTADLECLRVRDIWAFCKSQDILFWLLNIYLFFEYVRPQTLYPVLDIMPYNRIIIIVMLFLLMVKKNIKLVHNVENRLLLLFFGVVLLSSIFAISPGIAFDTIAVFISWLLIYFLITNIINTESRFQIFMLMFLLYNFKMSQYALRGWARIGFGFGKEGTGGGPGWFENSGEFAIEMCVFLPLAIYFIIALKDRWPKWKISIFWLLPLTAIAGIISSSSRGALVGGFAVMAWILLKSQKKILAALVLTLVCFLAYTMVPEEQVSRFNKAGEDQTSLARTERWEKGLKMAEMYPILGVGYGNWAIADVRIFSGNGSLSHNVFVECVSELGYSGLVLYILMILYTLVNNYRTRIILRARKMENGFIYVMSHGLDGALIGFMVSGFFVTVLYYPYFWINMALTVALHNIAQKHAIAEI